MVCSDCGSNNVVKVIDEEIYNGNDQEVEVFICMDCIIRMFGPQKECTGEGYA